MSATYDPIPWINAALARAGITEPGCDIERCFRVLCSIAAPYNLPLIGDGSAGAVEWPIDDTVPAPIEISTMFVVARLHGPLATTDFDHLSRLVVAAHHEAVRVQIGAVTYDTDHGTFACLEIMLHPRGRSGGGWERHPYVGHLATLAEGPVYRKGSR